MKSTWLRLELRRHWRSLIALALLVAVASGFVMAAAAGAQRGMTAIARMSAVTRQATLIALPNTPGFDWTAVAKLPGVAAVSTFAVSEFEINHNPYVPWFPPMSNSAYRTIESPVVFQGRLLNPHALNEVMVSPHFATYFHKKVGDTVQVELYSEHQLASIFSGGNQTPKPAGPVFTAKIVGVVESVFYNDEGDPQGSVYVSAEVGRKYPAEILGPKRNVYINGGIRLTDGAAGIPAFTKEFEKLTGRDDIEFWNVPQMVQEIQGSTSFEAWCLYALAAAAAIAACLLLGQAVARSAAAATSELAPLRALGLSDRESVLASSLPIGVAGLVGALVGVGGAIAASVIFPIGTASTFEPSPGISVDYVALGSIAIGTLAILFAIAWASSSAVLRQANLETNGSSIARWVTRMGLPASIVVGSSFALEPGRGTQTSPVRPALIGAVAGIAGIVGTLTFSAGLNASYNDPKLYGAVYQIEAQAGEGNQEFVNSTKLLKAILKDHDVDSVNDGFYSVGTSHGVQTTFITYQSPGKKIPFTVVDGRMPRTANEIALGPTAASALGASVGTKLKLEGNHGSIEATVVGLAFTPIGAHNSYNDSGFVTPAGRTDLWGASFKEHDIQVSLKTGANTAAALKQITKISGQVNGGHTLAFEEPAKPDNIARLTQIATIPQILGVFLVFLAIGTLGHALVTTLLRRRRTIAVLRALGMSPNQARLVSVTQATVVAAFGLLFGIPLGIALGRTLWRVVATATPVEFADPLAIVTVLVLVPATLIAANLLAAWPGHRAARLNVSSVLRTE